MYQLNVQVDNDHKNDLIFTDFETLSNLLVFIESFESHSNTICEYTILTNK